MKFNPVIWFEIYVQDLARATMFYEILLGIKLEPLGNPTDDNMQMMAFPMEMGSTGAGGALVKMEGVQPGPGGTLVYFSSDDVAIEVARIEAAGGKVFKDKVSIGQFGDIALGFDTEGNMFGLHNAPAGAESC